VFTSIGLDPYPDDLGRPAAFHTFRRTFISVLQDAGVSQRIIMQLARHKSPPLTNWVYTDSTKLDLHGAVEKLGGILAVPPTSPQSSPLFSGLNEVLVSTTGQQENSTIKSSRLEVHAIEPFKEEPANLVPLWEKLKMAGWTGLEPIFFLNIKSFNNADLVDC
jgi:hypothetical protein